MPSIFPDTTDEKVWEATQERVEHIAQPTFYYEAWRHARNVSITLAATLITANSALIFFVLTRTQVSPQIGLAIVTPAFVGAGMAYLIQHSLYKGYGELARFGFDLSYKVSVSREQFDSAKSFRASQDHFKRAETLSAWASIVTFMAYLVVAGAVLFLAV